MMKHLLQDNRGVGAIEYALVASLIAIAAITGYANLGGGVQSQYNGIETNLSSKL